MAEFKIKSVLIILAVLKFSNKIILHHTAICARNSISENCSSTCVVFDCKDSYCMLEVKSSNDHDNYRCHFNFL